jgi:hypothetical protein
MMMMMMMMMEWARRKDWGEEEYERSVGGKYQLVKPRTWKDEIKTCLMGC